VGDEVGIDEERINELISKIDSGDFTQEQLQELNASLQELQARYPDTFADIKGIEIDRTINSAGRYGEGGVIKINPDLIDPLADARQLENYQSRIARYKQQLAQGEAVWSRDELDYMQQRLNTLESIVNQPRWSVGSDISDIVVHEFGHALNTDLMMGKYEGIIDFLPPSKLRELGLDFTSTLSAQIDKIALETGVAISEYASTSGQEYFAEAFTSFMLGENLPINLRLLEIFRMIGR